MEGLISILMMLMMLVVMAMPFLLIGGLVAFVIVRGRRKTAERVSQLQLFAREMNWTYAPSADYNSLQWAHNFHLFTLGRDKRIENVMHGVLNGAQISLFDYVYCTGGGRNYRAHCQTVVLLRSPRLNVPVFAVRPESAWSTLGQAFGYQDIDFALHPNFSGQYLLRGQDEIRIRQTFNPHTLAFFEATPKLSVEGAGDRLLIYREEVLIRGDHARPLLAALVEESRRVFAVFEQASTQFPR
jgi:hypothetical protein